MRKEQVRMVFASGGVGVVIRIKSVELTMEREQRMKAFCFLISD